MRNSKRSQVELKRSSIESMSAEEPVPVEVHESEKQVSAPSGTLIEIEGVHLRSLDQAGIIHYIERHLARWPKNATVFVNNHECEFNEPPVSSEHRFAPEGEALEKLGDVELVIKVSKSFLEDDLRGISVFSNGVWHETTLGGSEGREMSQYIFGEIDVPALDDDKSPVMGRLVVKDSQAWGLGPLFRRRGGDPGDSLRIEFDLKTKVAVAELGQTSVDEDDEVTEKLP